MSLLASVLILRNTFMLFTQLFQRIIDFNVIQREMDEMTREIQIALNEPQDSSNNRQLTQAKRVMTLAQMDTMG